MKHRLKRILVQTYRWTGRILLFLFILLVLALALLQLHVVQTWLASHAVDKISRQTGTEIRIERLGIHFPVAVSLKGLYVADEQHDTLLYAGEVYAGVRMLPLLRSKLVVSRVYLEDIRMNVVRQSPDTVFNFDFLLQLAASDPPDESIITEVDLNADQKQISWEFDIGQIHLKRVDLRYADHLQGIDAYLQLDYFSTWVDKMAPDDMQYHLGLTRLEGGKLSLAMAEGESSDHTLPDKDDAALLPDIFISQLVMTDVDFYYGGNEQIALSAGFYTLDLGVRKIDLNRMYFELDHFFLHQVYADILTTSPTHNAGEGVGEAVSGKSQFWSDMMPLTLIADEFRLTQSSFNMAGRASHLHFDDIDLLIDRLHLSPDTLGMHLINLRGEGPGDIHLKHFSVVAGLGANIVLDQLVVETAGSSLQGRMQSSIPFGDMSFPLSHNHRVDLFLERALIGSDIISLAPRGNFSFESLPQAVEITARVTGTLAELDLELLTIDLPSLLSVSFSGQLYNVHQPENIGLDLPDVQLAAHVESLVSSMPDLPVPDQLVYPDTLSLVASMKGSLQSFEASADIFTNFATLYATFSLHDADDELSAWDTSLLLHSGSPLAIIGKDELLQDLAIRISAEGYGFSRDIMSGSMEVSVDSVQWNDYIYRGLSLAASIENAISVFEVIYQDDHIDLSTTASLDFRDSKTGLNLDLSLAHLNAHAIGLSDRMLAVQTGMTAHLDLTDSDFPVGHIGLINTHVLLEREIFSLDSLFLYTRMEQGSYMADIISPLLTLAYQGNVSPLSLPELLTSHILGYVDEGSDDFETGPDHARFDLSVNVRPSPYYHELLIPSLTSFEPFQLRASFNGRLGILNVETLVPDLQYADYHIRDLHITASSDADQVDVLVHLPLMDSGQLSLSNLMVGGKLREQNLAFDISFEDAENEPWLDISGDVVFEDSLVTLHFGSAFVFNRKSWDMMPDNYVIIGKEHLEVDNLHLSHGSQSILLQSRNNDLPGQIIDIYLQQLDLGSFELIGGKPLATGSLTGSVELSDTPLGMAFDVDLLVSGLGVNDHSIGDLSLKLHTTEPGVFYTETGISGFGNQLDIQGYFQTSGSRALDLTVNLPQLDFTILETFIAPHVYDPEGYVSGNMHIGGTMEHPLLIGQLGFEEMAFVIDFLQLRYEIEDEVVRFDGQNIHLDGFRLRDPEGNLATLNGSVRLDRLDDISYNLSINARNFLGMDKARRPDDLFFGKLILDADLRMRGSVNAPVVDGRLKLNQGSVISLVLPQTEPEAVGDDGVIIFVAPDEPLFADILADMDTMPEMIASFQNLDINLNLEIDPQTEIRLLLDEVAGDHLEIRGGGILGFGIDPGGRVSLAGRYEIGDGAYQMTFYDVIQRNFRIQPGGQIMWTGDPLEARVDITASYTVRASARELMVTHALTGGQPEQAFRQLYPFTVLLNMKGGLMQPEIDFEIELPPEHRGAMEGRLQTRLNELNQNESEVNKQVFALLVIGGFIQDDPLAGLGDGPGLASTARTSGSRILTQQLNRLSDRFVRGIDLNFDIESYEEVQEGQVVGRTELQLEVSRDFFNQRLRITAGGQLELEDETRRQLNPADIAGDFSVEYLLSPDGRYILKGFRERKYQDVFDSELIETGLSLVFRQTFNHFRELIGRKEENDQE